MALMHLFDTPGYEDLAAVLGLAYDRAAKGKGKQRHAAGRAFKDQPIMRIPALLGDDRCRTLIYQVIKKLEESTRLEPAAAEQERLDAIVYTAAAILLARELRPAGIDIAAQRPTVSGTLRPLNVEVTSPDASREALAAALASGRIDELVMRPSRVRDAIAQARRVLEVEHDFPIQFVSGDKVTINGKDFYLTRIGTPDIGPPCADCGVRPGFSHAVECTSPGAVELRSEKAARP